ncbi:hypothetical protein KA005_38910, partial [bacterium]|nr:hypothetical protein [bacterium]
KFREHDVFISEMMANIIKSAQHFTVPDDGRLFDDKLKGLKGIKARLPYSSITIEYYVEEQDNYSVEAPSYSPKRVVIASELTQDMLVDMGRAVENSTDFLDRTFALLPDDTFIQISVVAYFENHWLPMPMSWLMPITWDYWGPNMKTLNPLTEPAKNASKFVGIPFVLLPGMFNVLVDQIGKQEAMRHTVHDIADEITTMLELCEALACSNVTTDTTQTENKKVNIKRVKKGKLPLYETKVLSIEVPQTHERTGIGTQDRRSPRQHLRRGHIRILQSGSRIWINSCVVGDKEKGRIDKEYRVST